MALLKKKLKRPAIYLISPNLYDQDYFAPLLKKILETKMIKIFQLRLKNVSDKFLKEQINLIHPMCRKNKVLFIINDRPELVKEYDIDGVHLGENDLNFKLARKMLGNNKIIGLSCYNSPNLGKKAQALGANYIAFGSFFKTSTKINTKKVVKNSLLKWKKFRRVPFVGIGGINTNNFDIIRNIDFDFLAISSAVWNDKISPINAINKIKNII